MRQDIPTPMPTPPLFPLLAAVALAGPLALDPANPPAADGTRFGLPAYRFAPEVRLGVLPAVVVQVEAGAPAPPGGRALGGPFWLLPSADPVADALDLLDRPGVRSAFPDVVLPVERRGFDDPSYGGQWYLQDLGMDALFAVGLGDAEVRVAVIDSGIDIAHPDLADAVLAPYDAFSDDDDPSPDPGEFCTDGSSSVCDEHGTAVSGIVLARADNGAGIVGMCPNCTLVPIKMLGEGRGALSAEIAAFEHAIAQDVAVINNSWGYTEPIPVPDLLAEAIRRAATEPRGGLGALVVFAAGNDDREIEADEVQAMEEVLCVSGTNTYGYPVNYTNWGDPVDVAAPSATVTIVPGGGVTTSFGGTSAASPVAAGLAAWAASVRPDLSAEELKALLIDTATASPFVPPTDHDDYYGYGNLSAAGVLATLVPAGDTADTGDLPEEPAACGCAAPGAAPPWLGVLLALPLLRRRSSR